MSFIKLNSLTLQGVDNLLRELDDQKALPVKIKKLIIKPNLVYWQPYPVTTDPEIVGHIINFFSGRADNIIIAEENSELTILTGCTNHPGHRFGAGGIVGVHRNCQPTQGRFSLATGQACPSPQSSVYPRLHRHVDG